MVTVGMYYDVIAGQGPAFVEKFRAVLAALAITPGHKSSDLYRRVDDEDSFAILSEWDDQDAFLRFIRSDAFRAVTTWGRESVLRNAPRHKIYPRADDLGHPAAHS